MTMNGSRLRQAFESPFLAALIGAAVVAASLTLTGALDVTGEILARAGVRLTSSAGPTLTSGSGAPGAASAAGSLYLRTDAVGLYQNTDGATTWIPVFAPTPNAANTVLEIVDDCSANTTGTINLTTEGTIDWLYLGGTTIPTITQGHSKLGGPGWLRRGFWWTFGTGGIGFTSQVSGTAFTATASDDASNSTLTGGTDRGRLDGTVGATPATGYGWTITVPASPYETRLLRVYMGAFSNTVTFTATLNDGTTAPVTASRALALNTGNNFYCSVKYRSAIPVDLIVNVAVTSVQAGSASTSLSGMAQTISVAP